jgi:hypothetical protein
MRDSSIKTNNPNGDVGVWRRFTRWRLVAFHAMGFGFWVFLFAAFACTTIGAGCARPSPSAVKPVPASTAADQPPASADAITRTPIADGIDRVVAPIATSTEGSIDLYRFSTGLYQFGLAATSARLGMGEWLDAEPKAVAVVNGGYFMDDGSPSGYFSVDGKRIGESEFDLNKSAAVTLDDGVRIIDTSATRVDLSRLKTALQSYPLLVANGIPAVRSDSGKLDRRSFIGVDQDGNAWIGVVADGEISLHDLALRLVELDIGWVDVVNLDGGASTGYAIRAGSAPVISETFGGAPNVITVTKR